MNLKFLIPSLGVAAAMMSACAPFRPYDPDRHRSDPETGMVSTEETDLVTSPEQEELRTIRENIERETEERNEVPLPPNSTNNGGTPKTPGSDYRRATPIPGKEGFVFNPFTNNPVDVRGIPSGSLVFDPQDPNKERNRFRVP